MSSNRLAGDAVQKVTTRPGAAPAVGAGAPPGAAGNALTALVKYVPTEVVTLYVATVGDVPSAVEIQRRLG